ncbi:hypothetical protein [Psychromonas sp. KJ10-2]|uniref:hypothetical protein n=1 Tax=Psychromonas sp. KJ10-2 TaxID=3391822 RepID=UPI0039B59BF8
MALALQTSNPCMFSLWFYLVFSVSLHLAPSPTDMKNSSVGVLFVLGLTIICCVLLELYNLDLLYWIKQKLDIIAGFYLVSIVICLIAGGIILLTSGLIHAIQRKKERYIED